MDLEIAQVVASSVGAAGVAADATTPTRSDRYTCAIRVASWVRYLLLPLDILDIVLDFTLARSLWARDEEGNATWPDAAWGIALFFFTFVPCLMIFKILIACLSIGHGGCDCDDYSSKSENLVKLLARFLIEDSTAILIFVNVPSQLGSFASEVNLYFSIGTGVIALLLAFITAMILWRTKKDRPDVCLSLLVALLLAVTAYLVLLGIKVALNSSSHPDLPSPKGIFGYVAAIVVYVIGLLFGFCFFGAYTDGSCLPALLIKF